MTRTIAKENKVKSKTKVKVDSSFVSQSLDLTMQQTSKNVIVAGVAIIITAILFFVGLIFLNPDQRNIQTFSNVSDEEISKSNETQGELPQFFPDDFPVYENASLQNNWTTQSEKVTGVSVAWETSDLPTQVFNFYFTELQSRGYTVEVLSQTSNSYTLSLEKDNVSGFVGITLAESKTVISVTVGIKNE